MIDNARINTKWLRESIGNKIKIGIENNNYYPTEAYNIITEGDFLQKIVYENDLFFLLDIAHAKVTSANRKIDYNTYLNELPLDRMMQVHICKPTINHAGVSYDSHYLPDSKMFKEVENLSKNYSKLKYFTIEYYKDSERLISKLKLFKINFKKMIPKIKKKYSSIEKLFNLKKKIIIITGCNGQIGSVLTNSF